MNDLPSKKQLESTGENYGFRLNAKQFVGILIAVVLLIFILSNRKDVTVEFLTVEFTLSLWLVLTLTALAGAAIGALGFARRQKRRAHRA
ncbi:MAG: lipopolysaccharide assembly protein LapA domain-containing protein [Microthrixaceae bacterium]